MIPTFCQNKAFTAVLLACFARWNPPYQASPARTVTHNTKRRDAQCLNSRPDIPNLNILALNSSSPKPVPPNSWILALRTSRLWDHLAVLQVQNPEDQRRFWELRCARIASPKP